MFIKGPNSLAGWSAVSFCSGRTSRELFISLLRLLRGDKNNQGMDMGDAQMHVDRHVHLPLPFPISGSRFPFSILPLDPLVLLESCA